MPKIGDSGIKTMPKRFTAVGAYVFAGGFTVGVKASSMFDVLCHLEESDYGVATFKRNNADVPVHYPQAQWPVDRLKKSHVDFVYGNPPCAAWSVAGTSRHHGGSWRDSGLIECTRRHFSLLRDLRPTVHAWESVQQAWTDGREFVEDLAAQATELGYASYVWLHDASNLGVPQTRKRFFMVCSRVVIDFPERYDQPKTVAEALSEVGSDKGASCSANVEKVPEEWLSQMHQGETLRSLWERMTPEDERMLNSAGRVKGRPTFAIKRLHADRPSGVVRHELVHPTEPRPLGLKEIQHLCGYPLSYEFVGSSPPHQVGRGVCPPVAKHLAEVVASALAKNESVNSLELTIVDQTQRPGERTARTVDRQSVRRVSMPAIGERGVAVAPMPTRNLNRGLGRPGSRPQDLNREYDTTQLHEKQHGQYVHRDYAAHFFRWGWTSRMVKSKTTRVLDVGCGQDFPLVGVMSASVNTIPAAYVGVDLNRLSKRPNRGWIEAIYDQFDFPGGGWEKVKNEHEAFDVVTCFEVVEHMHRDSGLKLLAGMAECVSETGRVLLSTPVYDGKRMAANHIKEYTVGELADLIAESGLEVVERFGTFASWNDIRKVCTDEEKALLEETGRFYGGDVLACFLAPKYPDASRNNAWVLKRQGDA